MKIFSAALVVIQLIWSGTLTAHNRLSIHGYLSQGYAQSYGHQIFGITERGTSDYRNLALQFRYDSGPANSFVVQLSHRRQGSSPLMDIEREVLLDWAFIEHRFNDLLSAKFGKIQVPFGIYNEIRDVGTLLPFYHLPFAPYGEGTYTSETVNGAAISANLTIAANWETQVDIYGGEWDWKGLVILRNPLSGNEIQITDHPTIKNAVGSRLTLTPPISNLALGFSGYTATGEGGWTFAEDKGLGKERLTVANLFASIDGDAFYIRSELTRYFFKQNRFDGTGFYAQAGWHINSFIRFHGQYSAYHIYDLPISPLGRGPMDVDYYNDTGIAVTLHPSPQVVLRGEFHWNSGFVLDEYYGDYPPGSPPEMQYLILSVSTSF